MPTAALILFVTKHAVRWGKTKARFIGFLHTHSENPKKTHVSGVRAFIFLNRH
jgi:hypothetical protein